MKPARDLLVIDDEPVVVQGIARICRREGLAVETAASGREGLARLEQASFRLIICDIMMGDLDGFAFLAEAARRGHLTPVVMATGNSTVHNAIRSLQCGALDYLAKPFTADELLAVVSRGLAFQSLQAAGRLPLAAPPPPPPEPAPPERYWRLGYVSWLATERIGTVRVGASDCFVRLVQGIERLELSPVGTEVVQGTGCATLIAAGGLAHEILCPVTGQIIAVHAELAAAPATLARDAYGAGWFYRIVPSDLEDCLRGLSPGAGAAPGDFHREGEPP
jgi:CheY-like chemotaxis protein/glycine cleavage system H lipoate-binding protein